MGMGNDGGWSNGRGGTISRLCRWALRGHGWCGVIIVNGGGMVNNGWGHL